MKWLIAAMAAFLFTAQLMVAKSAAESDASVTAKQLFPDSVVVTVSTPMYSALHKPGREVRAILTHGAVIPDGTVEGSWLPPGTLLTGEVLAASAADAISPGRMEVKFSRAVPPRKFPREISAAFAAPGGILSADLQNMVLRRRADGQFDALEAQIRSQGGADPSVIRIFRNNQQKSPAGSRERSREVILDAGDQVLIRFEPR